MAQLEIILPFSGNAMAFANIGVNPIAAHVGLGTSKSANPRLHHWKKAAANLSNKRTI